MAYKGCKEYAFWANLDETLEKNTEEASDDIKEIVYEVISREGMDHEAIKVRITNMPISPYAATLKNTLLIDTNEAWKLSAALKIIKKNDAKQEIIKDHGQ